MKAHLMIGIALGAALLATGCASPPNEDTDAALMAFDRAVEAGAEAYAPDAYQHAVEARDALQAEVQAQEDRWLKQYGVARKLAGELEVAAMQAEQDAITQKGVVRDHATMTIAETQDALERVRSGLANPPRRRADAAALLQADVTAAERLLEEAAGDIRAERFKDASEVADRARTAVDKLRASVDALTS